MKISSELLSSVVAIALSIGFAYVPKLRDWYGGLTSDQKKGIMALLVIVAAVSVFALSCTGVISAVECSKDGAFGLLQVVITALVANQSIYRLLPNGRK